MTEDTGNRGKLITRPDSFWKRITSPESKPDSGTTSERKLFNESILLESHNFYPEIVNDPYSLIFVSNPDYYLNPKINPDYCKLPDGNSNLPFRQIQVFRCLDLFFAESRLVYHPLTRSWEVVGQLDMQSVNKKVTDEIMGSRKSYNQAALVAATLCLPLPEEYITGMLKTDDEVVIVKFAQMLKKLSGSSDSRKVQEIKQFLLAKRDLLGEKPEFFLAMGVTPKEPDGYRLSLR